MIGRRKLRIFQPLLAEMATVLVALDAESVTFYPHIGGNRNHAQKWCNFLPNWTFVSISLCSTLNKGRRGLYRAAAFCE